MGGSRGFTLTELVLVLVIVGVLGAMIVPRMIGSPPLEARTAADDIAAALRYAQQLGMNHDAAIRFRVDSGRYLLERDAGAGWVPHALPSGELEGSVTSRLALTPASLDLRFDRLGRPYSGSTALNVELAVIVSAGVVPENSHTLCVQPETGYVRVRHGATGC